MPQSQKPHNWKQVRNRRRPRKVVTVNEPTTIYDRMKLGAVQLLDHVGKFEDPGFMLVVSARECNPKTNVVTPFEVTFTSDSRMHWAFIEQAQKDYCARDGGKEGIEEEE